MNNHVIEKTFKVGIGVCNGKYFKAVIRYSDYAQGGNRIFLYTAFECGVSPLDGELVAMKIKLKKLEGDSLFDRKSEMTNVRDYSAELHEKLMDDVQCEIVYLNVPFEKKDKAKELGAIWMNYKRSWCVRKKCDSFDKLAEMYSENGNVDRG